MMSKRRKAHLVTFITNGIIVGTELGTAFAFISAGLLVPYAFLTVTCALTFTRQGELS